MDRIYDVIILGAGPAGLAAGIYSGRYKLSTLILERGAIGGQITLTSEIENYPGQLMPGIGQDMAAGENAAQESGMTLTARMRNQAEHFGAEFESADIVKAELAGSEKKLIASNGKVYTAKSVILAGGAHFRPIGCKNEESYVGAGISYCATCDANFFTGLEVYVVGGGDSAVEEAMYLTKFARHVTIIHRRDSLRAAQSIQEKAFRNEKISFMWNTVVEQVGGEDVLDTLYLRNVLTDEVKVVKADPDDGMLGLFGFIGMIPDTEILKDTGIELTSGYISAGEDTHTSLDGVFAAGDIRTKSLRQVVTACADGAVAAFEADRYINGLD